MADLIQIRRDTASNWTSANTVLAQGELGAETDTSKIKIGNGSTAWNSLAYLIDAGGYITATSTNTLTNKTLTSPVLTTPALGTPASGVMTNATGTAAGLTAGNTTTNANLTGHITSTGNAAVLGAFTAAQLNTAVSDATLVASGGALGTPSSGTATNLTGLPPAGVTGTAAILGANTFTGTQDFGDNIAKKLNLLDYGEVTNAIGSTGGGTQSIDLTLGNSVVATVDTSANTFTFDNPTATDEMCGFVLFLTNGGSQTVTWPTTVDWPAATAPTLSASGVDILVFQTVDGGTIWHGQVASTLSS